MLRDRQVAGLVADLQAKALGLAAAKEAAEAAKGVAKLASKAPTIPIAPNLTKPAPRKVKEPMRIAQEVQVGADPTYLDKARNQQDREPFDRERSLERA